MSLEEFLDNLTLEEIEDLKRLKKQQNKKTYLFSKIRDSDLNKLFTVKRIFLEKSRFDSWFQNSIKILEGDLRVLENLLNNEKDLIKIYKEEDLKGIYKNLLFVKEEIKQFGRAGQVNPTN
ncbi:MAG: hypothetical protein H7A23_19990 [Leptospiraceae bacterium]|nr:hypothetical protein [Leptospiraceae bacterium]MCP5496839.1 hypothetical protein [Leptospiraceae bacterium]